MKFFVYIILVLSMRFCFSNLSFEPTITDRLYIKEICIDSTNNLEWFYYSTAYAMAPDYIIINHNNTAEDTICVSTNIADIKLENSNIKIYFYGTPNFHGKKISLMKQIRNYHIFVDTTLICTNDYRINAYRKP